MKLGLIIVALTLVTADAQDRLCLRPAIISGRLCQDHCKYRGYDRFTLVARQCCCYR
jgi:hypothetical protein